MALEDMSTGPGGRLGVADVVETGNSLIKYDMGIVLELLQCRPVAVGYEYNPRLVLPSRASLS